MNKKII